MKLKKGIKTIRNIIFVGIVGTVIISGFNDHENDNEVVAANQPSQTKAVNVKESNNNDKENIESIITDMTILYHYVQSITGETLNNIKHESTSSTFEGTDDRCYEFKLDTSIGTSYLYVTTDMKYVYTGVGEKIKYSDFIDLCLEPFTMQLDSICRYITEEINTYGRSVNVSTITDIRDYIGKVASLKNGEKSVVVNRLYNLVNARIDAIETATGTIITDSTYDMALSESKEVNYSLDYTPVSNFSGGVNITLDEASALFESQFPNMGGECVELVQDGYMFEVVIEGMTYSYLISKDEPVIYDAYGYEIYSE